MIHDHPAPFTRAAGPPPTSIPVDRVFAEELVIGDQAITSGLILDIATISRTDPHHVEIGYTAGDDHVSTVELHKHLLVTVIVPRPADRHGVDRFDPTINGDTPGLAGAA